MWTSPCQSSSFPGHHGILQYCPMLGSPEVQLQHTPAVQGLESILYQGYRLPGGLLHQCWRSQWQQNWLETTENDVQGQRQAEPPDPHWQWDHHPGQPKMPQHVLDAITNSIKSEDHFWHFWDKLLSDACQLPNEGIHALNTRITTHQPMQVFTWWDQGDTEEYGPPACGEVPQSLGLDPAPRSVPADWQGPSSPIASYLSHYPSSTTRPRRKARQTSPPFLQWPPQHPPSTRMPSQPFPSAGCVATPPAKCPSHSKECYNCRTIELPCVDKTKDPSTCPVTVEPDCPDNQEDHPRERKGPHATNLATDTDLATPLAGTPAIPQSQIPSHSPSPCLSSRSPRWHRRSISFWYNQDSPCTVPDQQVETSSYPKEGSLLTGHMSDRQTAMKNGMKHITVKINPGAQVNTITLSKYQKIFPYKINAARYPKQGVLNPTKHSWIFHNGKLQPFLG